jgi:hypothetical protein
MFALFALFALSFTFGKGLIDLARGGVVDYFELLAEFRGLLDRLIPDTVKDT